MVSSKEEFVAHPRFGNEPIETGLNPQPFVNGVYLGTDATTSEEIIRSYESATGQRCPWRNFLSYEKESTRIPNTAIEADLTCQSRATIPVTHYFDLEAKCRDCRRRFIFFAQEQKYWYEELRFPLEASCVRCIECRKKQQKIVQARKTYEALFHQEIRTQDQALEMADACLFLIGQKVFPKRKTQTVRMLLNSVLRNDNDRYGTRVEQTRARILEIEAT